METIKVLIPYLVEPANVVIFLNGVVHEELVTSNMDLWKKIGVLLKREVIRVEGIRFHISRPDDVQQQPE